MTDPDLALSIAMDEARLLRRSIEALVKVIEEHEAEIERLQAERDSLLGQLAHIGRVSEQRIQENERLRDMHDAAVAKAIENANEIERLRAVERGLRQYRDELIDEVERSHREVERLRAVEQAAQDIVGYLDRTLDDSHPWEDIDVGFKRLREALKGGGE